MFNTKRNKKFILAGANGTIYEDNLTFDDLRAYVDEMIAEASLQKEAFYREYGFDAKEAAGNEEDYIAGNCMIYEIIDNHPINEIQADGKNEYQIMQRKIKPAENFTDIETYEDLLNWYWHR